MSLDWANNQCRKTERTLKEMSSVTQLIVSYTGTIASARMVSVGQMKWEKGRCESFSASADLV